MVVRGLRRNPPKTKAPEKLPITAVTLQTIKLYLDFANFDDVMFWAACCTAFFGFLRAAEFTADSSTFSPDYHLSVTSVSIDKSPVPDAVFLFLPRSKTDQFWS
eukprot:gene1769-1970_t